MLFVDSIIDIVKLGIASSYVKNDVPVSLMLLGDPEIGKSTILLAFSSINGTKVFTDLTKSKLEKFYIDLNNRKIKYLIVPDFIKVISRGKSTRANIITLLNAGLEEGIVDITEYVASIPRTEEMKKPIRFGLATSMTRDTISDRRREWFRIGFFSRLLPISFSYTDEQTDSIRDHIYSSKDIGADKINIRLRRRAVKCNKKFPRMFEEIIDKYAEAQHLYGFRMAKQIRGLLKASALLRDSDNVSMRDVKHIMKLSRFMNLDYNEVS